MQTISDDSWMLSPRCQDHARGLGAPVKLMDKTPVSNCNACDVAFSAIIRKHNCRACGHVFCGECSQIKMIIGTDEESIKRRLCTPCFQQMKDSGRVPPQSPLAPRQVSSHALTSALPGDDFIPELENEVSVSNNAVLTPVPNRTLEKKSKSTIKRKPLQNITNCIDSAIKSKDVKKTLVETPFNGNAIFVDSMETKTEQNDTKASIVCTINSEEPASIVELVSEIKESLMPEVESDIKEVSIVDVTNSEQQKKYPISLSIVMTSTICLILSIVVMCWGMSTRSPVSPKPSISIESIKSQTMETNISETFPIEIPTNMTPMTPSTLYSYNGLRDRLMTSQEFVMNLPGRALQYRQMTMEMLKKNKLQEWKFVANNVIHDVKMQVITTKVEMTNRVTSVVSMVNNGIHAIKEINRRDALELCANKGLAFVHWLRDGLEHEDALY